VKTQDYKTQRMNTKVESQDETALKRLYWHSRRGMLELDLLLVPFARDHISALDAETLENYRYLLEQEDQDLFLWLTRRAEAPEARLQEMVDLILARVGGPSQD
jgi:antitoxin CptB